MISRTASPLRKDETPRFSAERGLHLLAVTISLLTLCLLFVGAMVTSTNSGLAVPDWPTTFGHNMFAFPFRAMKGGILYEHGHRLFAAGVGFCTVVLTAGMLRWEPRRWVKTLALIALTLVCVQGVLGGMTVRFKLPIAVSSAHAGTAEVFFCITVWLAWATSAAWRQSSRWRSNRHSTAAFAVMALVFVQIMVGAVMRHSLAGLAIPTFPLAFGAWIPPFWSSGIAMNFMHTRIGPVCIVLGCALLLTSLWSRPTWPGAMRLGWILLAALAVQLTLGMLTIWTGKLPLIASLHLAGGAFLLATLFTIALWCGKHATVTTSAATAGLHRRLTGDRAWSAAPARAKSSV